MNFGSWNISISELSPFLVPLVQEWDPHWAQQPPQLRLATLRGCVTVDGFHVPRGALVFCHSVDSHTCIAKRSAMTNSGYSFLFWWGSHGWWLKQSASHQFVSMSRKMTSSVWMGRQEDWDLYVGSQRSKGNITLPPQTLGIPDFIPGFYVSGGWKSLVAPCREAHLWRTRYVTSMSDQMGILC